MKRAVRLWIAVILAAAAALAIFVAARSAAAEPQLDYGIRLAIKAHFEQRLRSETCGQYFRYYSMDASNWLWQAGGVKVQVVFAVEFLGGRTLYGNSERARKCLGRDMGEGFFQTNTSYQSAGFVYTLSKWSQGWHVDALELQP